MIGFFFLVTKYPLSQQIKMFLINIQTVMGPGGLSFWREEDGVDKRFVIQVRRVRGSGGVWFSAITFLSVVRLCQTIWKNLGERLAFDSAEKMLPWSLFKVMRAATRNTGLVWPLSIPYNIIHCSRIMLYSFQTDIYLKGLYQLYHIFSSIINTIHFSVFLKFCL